MKIDYLYVLPGKHVGEMVGEYIEHYNSRLKPSGEKAMNWSGVARRGGMTTGHMANIHNNKGSIDKKTGKVVPFKALPKDRVEELLKGIGGYSVNIPVEALREWFFSANNVETTEEHQARQAQIEQDLRNRGILDPNPPQRPKQTIKAPVKKPSSQAKPKSTRRQTKALVRRGTAGLETTPNTIPNVQQAIPADPLPPFTSNGVRISLRGFKMETQTARMSTDEITIEGDDGVAALGLLITMGGKKP